MSVFHERLQTLKNSRGLAQINIAEGIGVTPQAMSNYFNGREPVYDILCKIADYFDVSTDYLLGRTEFETPDEENKLQADRGENPSVGSVSLYRNSERCAKVIRTLYREKLDGKFEPYLLLDLWRDLTGRIETIQEIAETLYDYRDFSDRDEAIQKAIAELANSEFCNKIVMEIMRIERSI